MSATQAYEVELTTLKFDGKVHEAMRQVPHKIRQGPVIVSARRHTAWGYRRAHPLREAVSIFRSLSNTVGERVLFKIYRSSQGLARSELEKWDYTPDRVSLKPEEILFVKGDAWMDIVVPDGGSFVWEGYSTDAMGLNVLSPEIFPFVNI
jgi:hypothetical protein